MSTTSAKKCNDCGVLLPSEYMEWWADLSTGKLTWRCDECDDNHERLMDEFMADLLS